MELLSWEPHGKRVSITEAFSLPSLVRHTNLRAVDVGNHKWLQPFED